ncbi:GNAT family N-acetyltransferase [Niabella sp. CJ426]|uniref:GNAT family N-acetyltransferase n=1 Tax=Niabella sp. CJ426 TaxID=3393740 RepID=UPI003D065502
MKPEFEDIPLVQNEANSRFEIVVDGLYAFVEYEVDEDGLVALVHTEADPGLAGKGAAAAVVEKTLLQLEKEGKQILPYCPYVFAYIKKHPEWKRIVHPSFPAYHQF